MAAYNTKKQSWLRFLASLIPGAGAALLLCSFFAGPRLGPVYDFLLRQRSGNAISQELLLIDVAQPNPASIFSGINETANILEPSAAASLLLTSVEFGASTLVIEAPVLGLSAGGTASEEEIRYRFNDEFDIMGRNIRSLFDAIRTGSVSPGDAGRYVSELVELGEQGKERLVSALVHRDEEGLVQFGKAAKVFGNFSHPDDLLVQVIRLSEPLTRSDDYSAFTLYENEAAYLRATPDPDGVIRRIAPMRNDADLANGGVSYHIVYEALKDRYRSSRIENTKEGVFLVNERKIGGYGSPQNIIEQRISLDTDGALIFEIPDTSKGFRKVHIKDFLDYDEADRSLRRLLGEAEALGIYRGIDGERNPQYLWDYALSLKEELLEDQNEENKAAWIKGRLAFFNAMDSFLNGSAEMNLVSDFEMILATETLGEDGEDLITGLRDNVIASFAGIRQKHEEFLSLREKLSAMDGAFCILGPFSGQKMSDAEVSALLANSLLTGSAVSPGPDLWLLVGALICVFIAALILRPLGASSTLLVGLILSLFFGLVFSGAFVFSGIWLEPLVPAASVAALTVFSFIWAAVAKVHLSRLFKKCYSANVSKSNLKSLIEVGMPNPKEVITVRAAVTAVRNPDLLINSDRSDPRTAAKESLEFREKAANVFKQAGGTILTVEGDMVLACFGSPLERTVLRDGHSPSPYRGHINAEEAPGLRAAGFVSELLKREDCRYWHYGLDIGDCCFTWSPMSGYSGFGRPVIRAGILSKLVARYEGRPLISAAMCTALGDWPFKKIGSLKNDEGAESEAFYKLLL